MQAGVLALQGCFEPHRATLERLGVRAREVRSREQLRGLTQAAWALEDLQLTLPQGTLWRAGAAALALPHIDIAATIDNAVTADHDGRRDEPYRT